MLSSSNPPLSPSFVGSVEENAARSHIQVQNLRPLLSCAVHGSGGCNKLRKATKVFSTLLFVPDGRAIGKGEGGQSNFPTQVQRYRWGDISANRECSTTKGTIVQHAMPSDSLQHELLIDAMGVCDDP